MPVPITLAAGIDLVAIDRTPSRAPVTPAPTADPTAAPTAAPCAISPAVSLSVAQALNDIVPASRIAIIDFRIF